MGPDWEQPGERRISVLPSRETDSDESRLCCADVIRSGRAETTPEEIKLHGLNKPHPG